MIVLFNLIIMFGFVYFASLGIKTTIHNRRVVKDAKREAKEAARRKRHTPSPTIDGGILYGQPIEHQNLKRIRRR